MQLNLVKIADTNCQIDCFIICLVKMSASET